MTPCHDYDTIDAMARKQFISFRATKEERQRFKALAAEEGISLSDWVRQAVFAYELDRRVVGGLREAVTATCNAQDIDDLVSFAVKAKIDRIIKHWAIEDTRALLDYVYTDTAPMREAVFGENLDFSKIRRDITTFRPVRHLKLSSEKSAVVQKLLSKRPKKPEIPEMTPPRYDALYFESIALMDQENLQRQRVVGKVKILPKAARSISEQTE